MKYMLSKCVEGATAPRVKWGSAEGGAQVQGPESPHRSVQR